MNSYMLVLALPIKKPNKNSQPDNSGSRKPVAMAVANLQRHYFIKRILPIHRVPSNVPTVWSSIKTLGL
jgi:hypothetical protein